MVTHNSTLQSLITICQENEILPLDTDIQDNDDLFEYGVIDSMGLTILSCAIEEKFDLHIQPEIFVAELRTPKLISDYIAGKASIDASLAEA